MSPCKCEAQVHMGIITLRGPLSQRRLHEPLGQLVYVYGNGIGQIAGSNPDPCSREAASKVPGWARGTDLTRVA